MNNNDKWATMFLIPHNKMMPHLEIQILGSVMSSWQRTANNSSYCLRMHKAPHVKIGTYFLSLEYRVGSCLSNRM